MLSRALQPVDCAEQLHDLHPRGFQRLGRLDIWPPVVRMSSTIATDSPVRSVPSITLPLPYPFFWLRTITNGLPQAIDVAAARAIAPTRAGDAVDAGRELFGEQFAQLGKCPAGFRRGTCRGSSCSFARCGG